MKRNLVFVLVMFLYTQATAQTTERPNAIQLNLPGIFVDNYQLQYTRSLSPRWHASLAFRYGPPGDLPFKNQIRGLIKVDDERADNLIRDARLGNFAVTPELSYFFNGRGEGFYGSVFYRFTAFETSELQVVIPETKYHDTLTFQGSIHANSVGLQLGWQKNIGKRFLVDVWILGPHYGFSRGSIHGNTKRMLTVEEQGLLRDQLEDLSLEYFSQDVKVHEQGAVMGLRGPWAGLRTGISFGFTF